MVIDTYLLNISCPSNCELVGHFESEVVLGTRILNCLLQMGKTAHDMVIVGIIVCFPPRL